MLCIGVLASKDGGQRPPMSTLPFQGRDRKITLPLGQFIQRQQAAARGAVVAGSKRKRRLDLDADVVGLDAGAVVRAMHDAAAGAHRFETGEALLDPIGRRDRLDGERGRRRFAGGDRDQRAQHGFVRLVAEMNRHLPLPAIVLESGAGSAFGVEAFAEIGRQPAGGRLVAGQAGDGGGHSLSLPGLTRQSMRPRRNGNLAVGPPNAATHHGCAGQARARLRLVKAPAMVM